MSEQEVKKQFNELVNQIEEAAEEGKEFEVAELGTFAMQDGTLQFTPSDKLSTEINNKYAGMQPIELIGAFDEEKESQPQDTKDNDTADEEEKSIYDEALDRSRERDDTASRGFSLDGFSSTPQGQSSPEDDKTVEQEEQKTEEAEEEKQDKSEDDSESTAEEPIGMEKEETDKETEISSESVEEEKQTRETGDKHQQEPELTAEDKEEPIEKEEETDKTTDEKDGSSTSDDDGIEDFDLEEFMGAAPSSSEDYEETDETTEQEERKTGEEEKEETEDDKQEVVDEEVMPEPTAEESTKMEEEEQETDQEPKSKAETRETAPQSAEGENADQQDLQEQADEPVADKEEPIEEEETEEESDGILDQYADQSESRFDLDVFVGPEEQEPATGEGAKKSESEDEESRLMHGISGKSGDDQQDAASTEKETADDAKPRPLYENKPPEDTKEEGEGRTVEYVLAAAAIIIVAVLIGLKVYNIGFSDNNSAVQTSDNAQVTSKTEPQPTEDQPEVENAETVPSGTSEQQDEATGQNAQSNMDDNTNQDTDGSEPDEENTVSNDGNSEISQESSDQQEMQKAENQQSKYGLKGKVNDKISGEYTIIVHSLRKKGTAENKKQSLQDQDFRVLIRQADVNGTAYFRVSLGQFETLSDAQNATKNLPEQFEDNNFIQHL